MKQWTRIISNQEYSPIIVHIPHNSRVIPDKWRNQLIFNDLELEKEILLMTDLYTEELFKGAICLSASMIIADWNRLILDPERYADDNKEAMTACGMGVIYTKSAHGKALRRKITEAERKELLSTLYCPHHLAFENLIDKILLKYGHCTIIDGHSFPDKALPYEGTLNKKRPDFCIGTDNFHTPKSLLKKIETHYKNYNINFCVDEPFSGSLVPAKYIGDPRVSSIMLEVNRKLYMNSETGQKTNKFNDTKSLVFKFIKEINQWTQEI